MSLGWVAKDMTGFEIFADENPAAAPTSFPDPTPAPVADELSDSLDAARAAGFCILTDPDLPVDESALRLLPEDVELLGVEALAIGVSGGVLRVVVPKIPSPAEYASLASQAGMPVAVEIATPQVWQSLNERYASRREDLPRGVGPALLEAIRLGASDVHLTAGTPPVLRLGGELTTLEPWAPLSARDLEHVGRWVAGDAVMDDFSGDHDCAAVYGGSRWRVNIYRQRQNLALALRRIPEEVPPIEDLGLPGAVAELAKLHQGLVLFCGPTGSGKALALDTPIPTPDGWATMGELAVGDQLFDEQGIARRVTFTTEVMYDHPCFEMSFDDGSTVVADADHLWLTETQSDRIAGRPFVELTSSERDADRGDLVPSAVQASDRMSAPVIALAQGGGRGSAQSATTFADPTARAQRETIRGCTVKTTAELAATSQCADGGTNHSIPLTRPLQLPQAALPVESYVLGGWLAGGTEASSDINCSDPEVIAEIVRRGYCAFTQKTPGRFYIASRRPPDGQAGIRLSADLGRLRSLKQQLRDLGILCNKRIPSTYLRASESQRWSLLQGLMDTAGTVSESGVCTFSSSNELLARQMLELVESLSIKAQLTHEIASAATSHPGVWTLSFSTSGPACLVEHKARRIPETPRTATERRYLTELRPVASVPVRCIQVSGPSKLFLAGRSMIPTHNSTSMAALVDRINKTRHCHIVTIEDPVEYVHHDRLALIHQREVGDDTPSFAVGLRHVLRQDPDVLLVGEMRDHETMSIAVTAAETGHLVFATVHAESAQGAFTRIIDVFPSSQQEQIRTQLANTLRAIVVQTLVPRQDVEHGRQLVCEVLIANTAVRNLVRDKRLHELPSVMESGGDKGMCTMDKALAQQVAANRISLEEGLARAIDQRSFEDHLARSNRSGASFDSLGF